jgi:cytochrome b involved in lipid metabolism
VFVIVRNSTIPQSQCIFELNGPKSFKLNEFAELAPNGDFINTTEEVKEILSERLPPKKKRVRLQDPREEHKQVQRQIPMAEVRRHYSRTDCWTIYRKKVYDITRFLSQHPGGDALLAIGGKDCRVMAQTQHSWVDVERVLREYYIGELSEGLSSIQRSST